MPQDTHETAPTQFTETGGTVAKSHRANVSPNEQDLVDASRTQMFPVTQSG